MPCSDGVGSLVLERELLSCESRVNKLTQQVTELSNRNDVLARTLCDVSKHIKKQDSNLLTNLQTNVPSFNEWYKKHRQFDIDRLFIVYKEKYPDIQSEILLKMIESDDLVNV